MIDDVDFAKNLYFKTLQLFMRLYADAIGNFMSYHMCTGGMYLVGGLTLAILPFIEGKNLLIPYM